MPEFVCKYSTSSGEIAERVVNSPNEDLLRENLEKRGCLVFSIRYKSGLASLIRKRKFTGRTITIQAFMIFNHELATLIHAGLPILSSFDILTDKMKNEMFRDVLKEIREQLKSGVALSDAFAAYPQYFPKIYSATLKAGERSGNLEDVIRRYISYVKIVAGIKKRISSALVYPAILMCLSIVVVLVILNFVIPRFTDFYRDFDMELPIYSRMIIGLSQFFRHFGPFLLIGAVVGFFALRKFIRSPKGALLIDRYRLKIPFLGEIWQKYSLSQLSRALGTLLAGGIPLVSALETASGAVGNRVIGAAVADSVQKIREGQSLATAFEETGVMSDLVVEMIKVGESTGSLQEMLVNISDYYDEEIENALGKILSLIEPIILITMGILIAAMLASIYIPIFQTIKAIH
jgi:type IV pilus assembly protein PilC